MWVRMTCMTMVCVCVWSCKRTVAEEVATQDSQVRDAGSELLTASQHPRRLPEQGVDYDATLRAAMSFDETRVDFMPYGTPSNSELQHLVRGKLAVRHVQRPTELYGELDATFDPSERTRLMLRIEDRLMVLQPYTFLAPLHRVVYWDESLTHHPVGIYRPQLDILSWYKSKQDASEADH